METVETDPNYLLGAAKVRLALIKQIADQVIEDPSPDPDNPPAWSLLWDRIAQIRHIADLAQS